MTDAPITAEDIALARQYLSPTELAELVSCVAGVKLPTTPLQKWIPQVTPEWSSPYWLSPLTDFFEVAQQSPGLKLVSSTPPQVGKTETITHGLLWSIANRRGRHGYITYSDDRTRRVSKQVKLIAERAGMDPSGDQHLMQFPDGSSILFASIDGGVTGEPIDGILVCDDLIKNRVEANSPTVRQNIDDFLKSVVFTRCHPSAGKLINATRWHTDDPSGRLIARGWPKANLPAVRTEDGIRKALWPEGRPLEFLDQVRVDVGESDWWSLYMGDPRISGESLFGDVYTYMTLPSSGLRYAIGFDGAYSAKTSSDWCAAVVLAEAEAYWYVIEVIRRQCKLEDFADLLRGLHQRYPQAPMRWHCSTTEMGSAGLLQRLGVPCVGTLATADKLIRAQPVSVRWRQKRVLIPRDSEQNPWLDDFVKEVQAFTGLKDPHDDQVDAMSSAYSLLSNVHVPVGQADQTPDIGDVRRRGLELMEQVRKAAAASHGRQRGFNARPMNTKGV